MEKPSNYSASAATGRKVLELSNHAQSGSRSTASVA